MKSDARLEEVEEAMEPDWDHWHDESLKGLAELVAVDLCLDSVNERLRVEQMEKGLFAPPEGGYAENSIQDLALRRKAVGRKKFL